MDGVEAIALDLEELESVRLGGARLSVLDFPRRGETRIAVLSVHPILGLSVLLLHVECRTVIRQAVKSACTENGDRAVGVKREKPDDGFAVQVHVGTAIYLIEIA